MKRILLTLSIVLVAVATQAQIKMHSDGRITFQTLNNTSSQGISFSPAPSWTADFNGPVNFHNSALFVKNAANYTWLCCSNTNSLHAMSWVVTYPDWNTCTFYVFGNGNVYAHHHYIIEEQDSSKGSEAIDGREALSIITRINGFFYSPDEVEIPDLENNEYVDPEAVAAMYADFSKRSAGLSGSNLEEVFPEAVRTDLQNRLCIDYQSVVTMLVEAVKEQQQEIEALRRVLEENGLIEP